MQTSNYPSLTLTLPQSTSSPVFNMTSSQSTLLNLHQKFEICLGKLNSNSTKEIAFNECKLLISQNKKNPKSLRYYLSSLTCKTCTTSSAMEIESLLYGYISQTYKSNLLDPIDNPPNLLKTINRMLTQIRKYYLPDSNYVVHKACSYSIIEILNSSMPKHNYKLVNSLFFQPLISLISSGENINLQKGGSICLCDLIEYVAKFNNESYNAFNNEEDNKGLFNILYDINEEIINTFLRCTGNCDNLYIIECVYKLILFLDIKYFAFCLKELYERLMYIITHINTNSNSVINGNKYKILVLNLFSLIADKIIKNNSNDIIIGFYQHNVIKFLYNLTKDKNNKIQSEAKIAYKKWKVLEKMDNQNEKKNFISERNFDFLRNNSTKLSSNKKNNESIDDIEEPIDDKSIDEPKNYDKIEDADRFRSSLSPSMSRNHTKFGQNKNLFNSTNNIFSSNIKESNKNSCTLSRRLSSKNKFDPSSTVKSISNKKGGVVDILKITLPNLFKKAIQTQDEIFNSINAKLNSMENRINKVSNKLNSAIPSKSQEINKNNITDSSLCIINNTKIINSNTSSVFMNKSINVSEKSGPETKKIENWKAILNYLNENKIESAYNEALILNDDYYFLRLVNITGPILNYLTRDTAKRTLFKINYIFKNTPIANSLVTFLHQSINLPNNNFTNSKCLLNFFDYNEMNDIMNSLNILMGINNNLGIKAKGIYYKILEINKGECKKSRY